MEENEKVMIDKNELISKLNARYMALNERLKTEINIIIRYELKLAIEELMEVYKLLLMEN